MASTIEEQIKAIEEEIASTDYNKATQQHIGRLKAKLARLKAELEKRRSKVTGGQGYGVRKSGNATVALIGFPSVGKSTLLNKLTNARSEIGDYHFTTLDVVPGMLYHRGAKIQILDLPGLIKDASKGKGRGREVLSVVRSADLILLLLDIYETQVEILIRELENAGIRLNQKPPDVVVTKLDKGGISVKSTVKLKSIDEGTARAIVSEYGYVNAEVIIREDITADQLIDVLAGNRVYVKAIAAVNKIDLAMKDELENIRRRLSSLSPVFISAEKGLGLEELKDKIFESLDLIRIYLKPQGGEPDLDEPLVIRRGSTVGDVCDHIHRTFRKNFRYANVWGKSAKFPGQMVGLDHKLEDEDILSIVIVRTKERDSK
ncbi:MAG: GTP-binding protein [Methanomassiliicoccales archaeon]|jgi:small GTP-binding protein|nr:GTP-binding protein [Methanomassiliicoccales archaeon]